MSLIVTMLCLMVLGFSVVQAQSPAPEAAASSPAPVSSVASPAPVPSVPSDEQQLLTIEQDWGNAYLHGDAEYLSRLFTDDFVFTNGRAELSSKAGELREVHDRAVHYTVFENHDMTVHIHGDTAVVTGRTRFKGTIAASGKLTEAEAQFTNVFVRIDGHWRALAAHVSGMGG